MVAGEGDGSRCVSVSGCCFSRSRGVRVSFLWRLGAGLGHARHPPCRTMPTQNNHDPSHPIHPIHPPTCRTSRVCPSHRHLTTPTGQTNIPESTQTTPSVRCGARQVIWRPGPRFPPGYRRQLLPVPPHPPTARRETRMPQRCLLSVPQVAPRPRRPLALSPSPPVYRVYPTRTPYPSAPATAPHPSFRPARDREGGRQGAAQGVARTREMRDESGWSGRVTCACTMHPRSATA